MKMEKGVKLKNLWMYIASKTTFNYQNHGCAINQMMHKMAKRRNELNIN